MRNQPLPTVDVDAQNHPLRGHDTAQRGVDVGVQVIEEDSEYLPLRVTS